MQALSVQNSPLTRTKFWKKVNLYGRTAVLCYSWICLGLYSEVLGPALPTLQHVTGSNYEQISRALSSRAVGLFAGSLLGGILHDRFRSRRNLLLGIALLSAGTTVLLLPYCRSLVVLCAVLFWAGCSHGLHTTGGNPSLAELWNENSAGPFNLMHAGYGLGGALSPMILKPFAYSPLNGSVHDNATGPTNATHETLDLIALPIPCGLLAGLCYLCSVIFLFFQYIPWLQPRHATRINTTAASNGGIHSTTEECETLATDAKSCEGGSNSHGFWTTLSRQLRDPFYLVFISMVFVLYFCLVGNERVFGKFVYTYSRQGPLKFTLDQGYLITTMYWVAFCLARLVSFVLAFLIRPQFFFILQLSGTVGSALILNIFPYNATLFLVFATAFGTFKSPLFPTGLGVINRYIEVTGLVTLVINFGSSCGAIALQSLVGYLLDKYGQLCFLYTVLGSAFILLSAGVGIVAVGYFHGERQFHSTSVAPKEKKTEDA